MNAKQVYRAVSDMISQGYIESEASLRASLNRALAEIGRLLPQKQFLTLRHFRLPAVFRLPLPREVNKDAPLSVSAVACEGFFVKGSGRGEVLIYSKGTLLRQEVLDGLPFSIGRTLLSLGADKKSELSLFFHSESGMVLEELVLYEKADEGEMLCDGHYVSYCMASLLPGFISFSGECRKNGLLFSADDDELILECDRVRIRSDAKGVYEIGCYAAPQTVTETNENRTLDLSAELLPLLPLLTAYYACLEAEDSRAKEFLARYQEAKKDMRNTLLYAASETVEDVRGW